MGCQVFVHQSSKSLCRSKNSYKTFFFLIFPHPSRFKESKLNFLDYLNINIDNVNQGSVQHYFLQLECEGDFG